MSSGIFFNPDLFTKSYQQAIEENERTLTKIRAHKKELEDVKTVIEENLKHISVNVMVPIVEGKAFMKGKIVRTNEFTIHIGDGWFVKKSAAGAIETWNRQMERCNKSISEYEKEMDLLSSNQEVPNDYEIFSRGDIQEIVEPYDDDEEKRWREQHREKVRQYKKQLALNRENEEDLFKKLDKLEKLEEEEEIEEDTGDSDDDDEDIDEEEYHELIEKSIKLNEELAKTSLRENISDTEDPIIPKKALSKRVSFSESLETTQEYRTSIDDDINIIHFTHNPPSSKQTTSPIGIVNSPEDIWKLYLCITDNIVRKPILKKSQFETSSKDKIIEDLTSMQRTNERVQKSIIKIQRNSADANCSISLDEISTDQVIGNIVEKTPSIPSKVESNPRPVSKFKKSQMKTQV